jgi:hypothetical protein
MPIVKSIKKIGRSTQKCLTVSSPDGLFVLGNGIVTHNSQEKVFQFFTKLRQRIDNRMKGNYYGRFILDSSPSNMEDVIQKWIVEDAPKNQENLIITGSRWEHFPYEFPDFAKVEREELKDKDGKITLGRVTKKEELHDFSVGFPMFKGGSGKLPQVIQNESMLENFDPADIFWCPRMQRTSNGNKSFYDMAMENPIEFMRDYGGIPIGAADRIFYDPNMINQAFDNNLKNLYGYITAPADEEPEHLIWNQVRDTFFYKVLDKYYFYYKPDIPRVLSVDQSLSGDLTCISVSHNERDPILIDTDTGDKLTIVITDFTIVIAPKGSIINLDAIKFFIMDLVELGNLSIRHVSFDQFQSASTQQFLKRKSIPVEKLSVDIDNEAYMNFIDRVQHKRYFCGNNIFMRNNMKSLYMKKTKTKTKVDHFNGDLNMDFSGNWDNDIKTSFAGFNAKDSCDAVAANCGLLSKYSNEFIPVSTWNPTAIYDRSYDTVKKSNLEYLSKSGFVIV